jgi:hypothetical protein
MLTFQIGLHIDDLFILEYIKNKLWTSFYFRKQNNKNVIILLMIKILYYKIYYLFLILLVVAFVAKQVGTLARKRVSTTTAG